MRDHLGYLLTDPEVDNFTYELSNESELVSWLAREFSAPTGKVAELLIEARSNPDIYDRLTEATKRRPSMRTCPPLGRRLGWYVIVRLIKPQRVIETGIHDGIGSLVFLAALDRNATEGADGDLVSFDVDPTAGWLVGSHPRWSRRIEDAVGALPATLGEKGAQIFLHDSLHTYEHERAELELAAVGMTGGVLLSDNSHSSSALSDLCADRRLRYSFFRERPRGHFYPGAGIGAGWLP